MNVMKHAISVTTNIDAPSTTNLPQTSSSRVGIAAKVVRIEPEEYSLVIKRVPITPTANWAKSMPLRLADTGSKVSRRTGSIECQCARTAVVINAPRPMVRTKVMTTPMMVERTVRNLIHSDRIVEPSVTSLLMARPIGSVLHGVGREVHVHLFERGTLRREFVERNTRVKRDLTDLLRGQIADA